MTYIGLNLSRIKI